MPYDKTVWENKPSKATPISAESLNNLETQYDEAVADSAADATTKANAARAAAIAAAASDATTKDNAVSSAAAAALATVAPRGSGPGGNKRAVAEGELQLNVYDYGAFDTTVAGQSNMSSQTALDAVMVDAEKLAAAGDRVWVTIPHGAVKGSFRVKSGFVCFTGPGTLLDGEILYQSATTNALPRFYSVVTDMGFRPSNPASARTGGIRILGGAFIEIHSCKFQDMENAVLLDTWENLTGQQNKTVNMHDNQIVNVDRAFSGNNRTGTTWDAHADLTFVHNIVRNGYIRHVDFVGVDGIDISDNVMFNVGYQSTDTFHLQMKQDTIYIGPNSQWIGIAGNKIFESGFSGINLDGVRSAVVDTNQLIWTGQVSQTPAIRIATSAARGVNNILISNNVIDECTQHGIAVVGDGNARNIFIPDNNTIRIFRATTRNTYVGPVQAVTNNIARIFVDSTVTVPPRINISASEGASRKGVLSIAGMYSLARRQFHADNFETTINITKTVVAGTKLAVGGVIRSTADIPTSTNFVGEVTVTARHLTSGLVARYKFTVAANGGNKTVANLQSAGSATNLADGTSPAFGTWSMSSGGASLEATPTPNTAGQIEFSITATGFAQVSYSQDEFNAIPLANPF